MTVGVVGLGLIGGSIAKAYKANSDFKVLGADSDSVIVEFAKMAQAIDEELGEGNLKSCDVILVAIPPVAAVDYLKRNAKNISKKALVIDCCGTKRIVCEECFKLAEQFGFTFVGGHPMAGTHNSGFKYARANLFNNAPMVIVPPVFDDMQLLERAKDALKPLCFGKISVTTAKKHDEMIAFTSQMAHVVSNAYIKSPTAREHRGFSAGSYKDLTRVAWLNPYMWAELFLENQDNLLKEIDCLIDNLNEYRSAIANKDQKRLIRILDEGRKIKAEVDGR